MILEKNKNKEEYLKTLKDENGNNFFHNIILQGYDIKEATKQFSFEELDILKLMAQ